MKFVILLSSQYLKLCLPSAICKLITDHMRVSIIAILLSISAMSWGQDTIPITEAHQKILPELIQKMNLIKQEEKEVNEKIMILILGYLTDEKHMKALQENRVGFAADGKSLVITEKKAE